MDIKPKPNHDLYIRVLRGMTPEQRLSKAFELSQWTKQLFLAGLKERFPNKTDAEIRKIYIERLTKCYNRNY